MRRQIFSKKRRKQRQHSLRKKTLRGGDTWWDKLPTCTVLNKITKKSTNNKKHKNSVKFNDDANITNILENEEDQEKAEQLLSDMEAEHGITSSNIPRSIFQQTNNRQDANQLMAANKANYLQNNLEQKTKILQQIKDNALPYAKQKNDIKLQLTKDILNKNKQTIQELKEKADEKIKQIMDQFKISVAHLTDKLDKLKGGKSLRKKSRKNRRR